MMPRSNFIDFAKGILIILVTIGHAIQFAAYQNEGFWDDPLFKLIYMFHMPLFMALSGYVSNRGITQTAQPLAYAYRRTKTIVVPIFVWAALFETMLLLLGDKTRTTEGLPGQIVKTALGSLWFLWALLWSIWLVLAAQATRQFRLPAGLLLFVVVLLLPDDGNLYLFKYTCPFFIAGFYAAEASERTRRFWQAGWFHWMLLAAAVVCFQLWEKDTYIYTTKMALTSGNYTNIALRWIAGAVASGVVLHALYRVYQWLPASKVRAIILRAGRDSLQIYIVQGYLLMLVTKAAAHWLVPTANAVVAATIGIAVGVALSYLSWVLSYPLARQPLLAQWLFGKR